MGADILESAWNARCSEALQSEILVPCVAANYRASWLTGFFPTSKSYDFEPQVMGSMRILFGEVRVGVVGVPATGMHKYLADQGSQSPSAAVFQTLAEGWEGD